MRLRYKQRRLEFVFNGMGVPAVRSTATRYSGERVADGGNRPNVNLDAVYKYYSDICGADAGPAPAGCGLMKKFSNRFLKEEADGVWFVVTRNSIASFTCDFDQGISSPGVLSIRAALAGW